MSEVLITGFDELPDEKQQEVLAHVTDPSNWARLQKKRAKPADDALMEESKQETALVNPGHHASRGAFIIPTPGANGAEPDCLAGKRFVLTGVFPEGALLAFLGLIKCFPWLLVSILITHWNLLLLILQLVAAAG